MTRIMMHPLPGDKRAGLVVREIVRLYGEGRRTVVWVADDHLRGVLDDYLWTFEQLAFVPHVAWNETLGEVEDPVVLVGQQVNPNNAEALVVADELPPDEWVIQFEEVHDFLPPGEAGDQRSAWWEAWRERWGRNGN